MAVEAEGESLGLLAVRGGARGGCGPGDAEGAARGVDYQEDGCDEDEGVVEEEGGDGRAGKGAG